MSKARPRPRRVTTSDYDADVGTSQMTTEEEDDFFITKRSDSGWKALNKLSQEAKRESVDIDSNDDSDLDDSPRRKKTKKSLFKTGKPKELPDWTREKVIDLLSSGDEDKSVINLDESEEVGATTPERNKERRIGRSPSLTPPIIDPAEKLHARRIVLEHMQATNHMRRRSPEPSFFNESDTDDAEELDPELIAIRTEARQDALQRGKSKEHEIGGIGKVECRVRLHPHPQDSQGKVIIYNFTLGRSESFESLFDEVADQSGIPRNNLIILHNNFKVYPTSTPSTLKIWAEAELDAYEEHVLKIIKEQEGRTHYTSYSSFSQTSSTSNSVPSSSQVDKGAESDSSQGKDNTFKITLRSGSRTITVTVRPTTKCSSIVSTFVKKSNLPPGTAKKARIEVDGEKMDPDSEIGDADLEDGDQVDIVGLEH